MSWQIRHWKVRDRDHGIEDIWRLDHVKDGHDDLPSLNLNLPALHLEIPTDLNLNIAPGKLAVDLTTAGGPLAVLVTLDTPPIPAITATKAVLSIGGIMPNQITVDTTPGSESVALDYTDDKGDPTPAPAGASVVFASDNAAVLAIGDVVATETGFSAPLTPGTLGSYSLSAVQSGAFMADGVTPIADPSPFTGTVIAGPAAVAILSETP